MENIKPHDRNGVAVLWTQILLQFVRKEEGKDLSTNDLTDELLQKIQSAGTSNFDGNYNSLIGQPSINGITLEGNKTLEDLGITKAIIDAIGNVTQISFEVKESFSDLPLFGEVGTFYLVPNNARENDNYREYIWDVNSSQYELIGTIQNKIDLSEYVKRDDVKPMIDNNVYSFTESEKRNNIVPSDPIKVILGKIMKWFSDLSAGAASSLLGQNLTENKALISDTNGKVAASDVDASKVEFLSGVTSDIQEQINSLNSTLENIGDEPIKIITMSGSVIDLFEKCRSGLNVFICGGSSVGLPSQTTEWKYGCGLLFKRSGDEGTMMLFGYNSTKIAICPISNKNAGSWRII